MAKLYATLGKGNGMGRKVSKSDNSKLIAHFARGNMNEFIVTHTKKGLHILTVDPSKVKIEADIPDV